MMSLNRRQVLGAAAAGAMGLAGCSQNGDSDGNDEITEDWDDWDDVVSAAIDEGVASYYTAGIEALEQEVNGVFSEEYDIDVDMFRSGGSEIMQRYTSEVQAGNYEVDVIGSSNPSHLATLEEQGLLAESISDLPNAEHLPDENIHDGWASTHAWSSIIIYNSSELSEDEVPQSWEEFASEEYEGMTTVPSPVYAGTAVAMVAAWYEMFGDLEYLERLDESNTLVRQGYGDTQSTVLSGDRPIGIGISLRVYPAINDGADLGVMVPDEGTPTSINGIGLAGRRPNENAGRVFQNFQIDPEIATMQTEIQGYYSLVSDEPPLGIDADWLPSYEETNPHIPDVDWMTDNLDFIQEEWNTVLG